MQCLPVYKNKLPKSVGVLQPLISMVPIVKFGDLSENLKFSRAPTEQPADQKILKNSQKPTENPGKIPKSQLKNLKKSQKPAKKPKRISKTS